jgi:flagellar hook-associated protein 2
MSISSTSLGAFNIDGLISGLDTTSILTQLTAVQKKPLTRLNAQKSDMQVKLATYRSISASLKSAATAASELTKMGEFIPRTLTVGDSTRVAASGSSSAQEGSYELVVEQLAQAHKIAGGAVASTTSVLGYSGDIRINGKTISLASTDTLASLREKITKADAGVNATVLTVSSTDHRLLLTSSQTGAENAIDLVDASGSGILAGLGLTTGNVAVKHPVTNGVSSDGVANSAYDVAVTYGLVFPPAGTVMVAGQPVGIDLAQDSLEDIRDKVNAQVTGVTAEVVSTETDEGTRYSLKLTGETGAPTLTDSNGVLETLGFVKQGIADERSAAQNARATVDGVTVERSTNSFDEVISGVSMELLKADKNETVSVKVAADYDTVVKRVNSFVTAYNDVVDGINAAMSYDSETELGGTLFGDGAMLNLTEAMRGTLTGKVVGGAGQTLLLSRIGITTDAEGKLEVDTTELRQALAESPDEVAAVFGTRAEGTTSAVTYSAGSSRVKDSGNAGYEVNITQAATRATARSATLASGITQAETLTFDGKHDITLRAGMSVDEARDHLNMWFGSYNLAYSASVEGNQLKVTHRAYGAGQSIGIKSSLADGSGGTDLGGATAGTAATYAGTDVVGTIGGETASGYGQYLTGLFDNKNTSGLSLKITSESTGNVGSIVVTRGAASRFADFVDLVTDSTYGTIVNGEDSIEKSIERIDDQIQKVNDDADRYTAKMRTQFTAMETALGKAQALQQYMTGQLGSLQTNYSGNG